MLEVNNIFKTFNAGTVNEKTALNGVSLHLNEGESVAVIGGNGAGKSTLLNAVAGVWSVDGGSISIGGVDVTHLPAYDPREIELIKEFCALADKDYAARPGMKFMTNSQVLKPQASGMKPDSPIRKLCRARPCPGIDIPGAQP